MVIRWFCTHRTLIILLNKMELLPKRKTQSFSFFHQQNIHDEQKMKT